MNKSNAMLRINVVGRIDPTRTLSLRRQFVRESDKRLRQLKRAIRKLVVQDDAFDLTSDQRLVLQAKQFQFDSNPKKVEKFGAWLELQHKRGLLDVTIGTSAGPELWANKYIRSAYQKGLSNAQSELIAKLGIGHGIGEGIEGGFFIPRNADAVGMMYARNFRALKGITGVMDAQMSEVLTSALAEGVSPFEMARRLNDIIEHTTGKPLPRNNPKGHRKSVVVGKCVDPGGRRSMKK